MEITLRPLQREDARAFLEVHHAAIRGTAAADYPAEVIEAWAPAIEEAHILRVGAAEGDSVKIVALAGDAIAGIGEVAPATRELRACYVDPAFGRRGIGGLIVARLEQIAQSDGAPHLWLDSSITAYRFYESLGYRVTKQGEHVLRNGVRMTCIHMEKQL